VILGLLVVGCGEPLVTPEPVYLRASGSMTMGPLVSDLASVFHTQRPNITIEVHGLDPDGGLGTQFGLAALRDGRTDLALVSWLPPVFSDLERSESGLDPAWQSTAIARDGLAIIVHPDNTLEGVGLLQLRDLFSGRSADWEALDGSRVHGLVQPVSREDGSGERAAFEALVMEDLPVTPRAVVAPSGRAMVDLVAHDPQAIGYVSMSQLSPKVRALKVEGQLPTKEAAGQGIYPLTRELWLVTRDPPLEALQVFVDFALSPAGQQIVGQRFGRIR
jgi:phosphate transport system substrate-binding protein